MKILCSIILSSLISTVSLAQIEDSIVTSISDTLQYSQVDSIINQQAKSDLDTVVYSSASDSLIFYVKDKKMSIHGDGKIEYQRMKITSANILIDFERNELKASGEKPDSVGDKIMNTPVLSEAGESYEGKKMTYNFKTGQGVMSAANTEIEGGFFSGEDIKKVDNKTYFIRDGYYTTCDDACPHYFISSSKMKVVQDEELVAEWIWLNFGDVPFPVPLPFGVFPIQSGRRSGIIAPVFGSDATYGTYICEDRILLGHKRLYGFSTINRLLYTW